ncbi:MAG: cytochrome c oxidase subunit 3 [Candidatus Sulfotelmatobacter sp.]
MATYSTHVDTTQLGHGGRTPAPPVAGGGDSGGNGGEPNYGERLRRARLGLVCLIAPIVMLFVSLTSAYIVRQGLPTFDNTTNTYVRDWGQVNLPWILLAINTAVLLISSLTMEAARRDVTRQAALAPVRSIPGVSLGPEPTFPWLGITVVLGLGFLIGQWLAWKQLENRGFFVATNPNSSFVYLLTGAHAVHLAGGIIALLWAAIASLRRRPVESRRIVVDVAAWYWHFMALLWIYVFALLEIAR